MASGVQVAVRVRPFNSREMELQSQLCVAMKGNQTILKNLESKDDKREFVFDYSFWSHDEFRTLPNGYNEPDGPTSPYADQNHVYQVLGESILDNAWQGYHCTLFAYGQTGSGKSYSVMGYGTNKGVVPIACEEIFKRIDSDQNEVQYDVLFGMMEIYNERVQDLQIAVEKRPQQGMKIRESKSLGFYAEGLIKIPVRSFAEIEKRMDEGNKHRSVGATLMNATSSRAHTIIMIELKQVIQTEKTKTEKLSVMNLVDLAGSEKVGKTGASGDRLKEASNINKSLSMLGMVISTLADIQNGKTGKKVPYRDSALTKLLANALGGNSKTIMICAISPAYDNYEESLSTLRYADQAKKIKNRAEVNESATEKLIRELKEENAKLLKLLDDFKKNPNDPEALRRLLDVQDQVQANEKLIGDQDKSADERVQEFEQTKIKEQEPMVDMSQPYLSNLNEDPSLSGKVQYQVANAETHVGRKQGDPAPQIILNGLGVKPNHCKIENAGGSLFLVPGKDPSIPNFLYLNGQRVTEKIKLHESDRIVIGTNSAFVVKIPGQAPGPDSPTADAITWELAQEEVQQARAGKKKEQQELQQQLNENLDQKIQEAENKYQRDLNNTASQRQEIIAHQEKRMAELIAKIEGGYDPKQLRMFDMKHKYNLGNKQDQKKDQIHLDENDLQQIGQLFAQTKHQKLKQKIDKHMGIAEPLIQQMNLLAEEFQRKIVFETKLCQDEEEVVKITIKNNENNTQYTWPIDKTQDRKFMIEELYEEYNQSRVMPECMKNPQTDPFWDPADPHQVGKCNYQISPAVYFRENPSELWIFQEKTEILKGIMMVNIKPVDQNGQSIQKKQNINNPNDLIGTKVNILIQIPYAKLADNVKDSYVEYILNGKQYKTDVAEGLNENPIYNYQKIHTFDNLTSDQLDYLHSGQITFKIFGNISKLQKGVFRYSKNKQIQLQFGGKILTNESQGDQMMQSEITNQSSTSCCQQF